MSLLKTAGPGPSSDEMEKVYQAFMDSVGAVPPSFLMCGASPGIQALQADVMGYLRDESNLSSVLMALIRYLTALALGMEPCIRYSARVLEACGMTEEQIEQIALNPAVAPLDEKEGWLLAFVIRAVRAPESTSESHVLKLRDLGWTDADIFDALYISCSMAGMEKMMKALKFEYNETD